MRAREINRRDPLTAEQVSALKVGDKIRSIPDHVYYVHGIVHVEGHPCLYVLRTWSTRHQDWRYDVERASALTILYTAEK